MYGLTLSKIDTSLQKFINNTVCIDGTDLNKTLTLSEIYDVIYDPYIIENLYNIPQAYDNIIRLLKIGGIFCSINTSGCFYTLNKNFFLYTLNEKYGMEIIKLIQTDTCIIIAAKKIKSTDKTILSDPPLK